MPFSTVLARALNAIPLLVTWLILAAALVLIASTYVGGASSPYDMCTRPNGRTVPCALQRAAADRP